MLRFASKHEALQHLADLTGKQVRVASDFRKRKSLLFENVAVPLVQKELGRFLTDETVLENAVVFTSDVTDQVGKLLSNSDRKQEMIDLEYLDQSGKLESDAYFGVTFQARLDIKENGFSLIYYFEAIVDLTNGVVSDSLEVSFLDPQMKQKIADFVHKFKQEHNKFMTDPSVWVLEGG